MRGTSSACWILDRVSRRNETEFMMQEIYRQPTREPVPHDIYAFFIKIENELMAFQHLRMSARLFS